MSYAKPINSGDQQFGPWSHIEDEKTVRDLCARNSKGRAVWTPTAFGCRQKEAEMVERINLSAMSLTQKTLVLVHSGPTSDSNEAAKTPVGSSGKKENRDFPPMKGTITCTRHVLHIWGN